MFWLIAILLFFVVGVAAFELVKQDAGYVLISFGGLTIETSFWFSLFSLLCIAIFIFGVLYLTGRITSYFSEGSRWVKNKRALSIEKNYRDALLYYLTEDYAEANQLFSALSKKNGLPVVKAIASAKSAMASGNSKRALAILSFAEKEFVEDRQWLLKAKLQIQLELNDQTSSLDTLKRLTTIAPDDSTVKKLAFKVHSAVGNEASSMPNIALEIPSQLSGPESDRLLLNAFKGLAASKEVNTDDIEQLWAKTSKEQRQKGVFQQAYVEALCAVSEQSKAEKYIEKVLSKTWNAALVDIYAKSEFSGYERQLKKAESWRKLYSDK